MTKTKLIVILLLGVAMTGFTQRIVTGELPVNGQKNIRLDFKFSDAIVLETWNEPKVWVEATVSIDKGRLDSLFVLVKEASDAELTFAMKDIDWNDHFESDCMCGKWMIINYRVRYPASMTIDLETISGSVTTSYSGQSMKLKTISGDVDIAIPSNASMDVKIKTITGEIYTDIDFDFPEGKDGLRQMVGMNTIARLGQGENLLKLETVNGDVFLRKTGNW